MSYFLYLVVVGTLFPDDDKWRAEKAEEGTMPDTHKFKSNKPYLHEFFPDNT